jgi:hypothetical protein
MSRRQRSSLVGGVLLVLVGALMLALQVVPGLRQALRFEFSWPWIIMAVGAALLVFGLLVGAPGMAVPACVVGGIGALLQYQNTTGDWASWAYAWTLIPGFVGVGVILAGLLGDRSRGSLASGSWLVFISLVLFAVFSAFLGGRQMLGAYWPALLIVLGVVLLLRAVFGRHR